MNLTASAERHTRKHGIFDKLVGTRFSHRCLTGDLVSLENGGARHDFMIIRRRWIIGDGGTRLELTLDYPARSALG